MQEVCLVLFIASLARSRHGGFSRFVDNSPSASCLSLTLQGREELPTVVLEEPVRGTVNRVTGHGLTLNPQDGGSPLHLREQRANSDIMK